MIEFAAGTGSLHKIRTSIMDRLICIFRVVLLMCCTMSFQLQGAEAESDRSPDAPGPVWVLSNGFHSAIALRKSDAGPLLRKSIPDPAAKWVMIGWGDREFFMARRPNLWTTAKAALWPTDSALHVIPLRKPPEAVYRRSDIVRLKLSPANLARIRDYLDKQFAKDRKGSPVFLRKGFSERSAFFLGSEKFYFPKMCNWWVAEGLQEAGVPVSRVGLITADGLTRQVQRHGEKTGRKKPPREGF